MKDEVWIQDADEVFVMKRFRERKLYAGIDEVGYGTLAGPIAAAVVVLPESHGIKELPVDSKLLSEEQIVALAKKIKSKALFLKICYMEPEKINHTTIHSARLGLWKKLARCVRGVREKIPIVVDGNVKIPGVFNQKAIIGADDKYANVSAAAIVSKAWTIWKMKKLHALYPEYNFAKHKGYPTDEHMRVIREHGISPVHRKQMTAEALEKGDILKEAILSNEEVAILLKKGERITEKHPRLVSEWNRKFILELNERFFLRGYHLSPKEMFYLKEANGDFEKRAKRHGIDLSKLSFEIPKKETCEKTPIEMFKEILPLLKGDMTLTNEWGLRFLSDLHKKIKEGKTLTEKQLSHMGKIRREVLYHAKKRGLIV